MTTNCDNYRETLQTQFDAGAKIDCNAKDHAAECAACAAFRSDLLALASAFSAIPLEAPPDAIAQRVKSRIALEPAYSSEARWWLPAAAILACMVVVGAALFYSIPLDPWVWWDYANTAGATPEWMQQEVSFEADLAHLQTYWNEASRVFAPFSTPWMWATALAAAILLAGLNGVEAYRLRMVSNQTNRISQWR